MTFPEHLAEILNRFGVPAATQAALYDLYLSIGSESLDAFAEWTAATGIEPSEAQPHDMETLRRMATDRYLQKSHPAWLKGDPTPTLYHPREGEGRFAGVAVSLGALREGVDGLGGEVFASAMPMLGEGQSLPPGVLMLSRNGHFGGRSKTVSFEVIPEALEDALLMAQAEGRQHTLPGSAGEATGTVDGSMALVWEVQPNVLKPEGERNREIRSLFGKHRNWHIASLTAALLWLRGKVSELWIVRGDALSTVHEVNPARPVGEIVPSLHDRTVRTVTEGLGMFLTDPPDHDKELLLDSELMNTALGEAVREHGAAPYLWRARW
jgi:hypothetical protein